MDNYRKLDPLNYGYLMNPTPINLKKQTPIYLPSNYNGQRNLAINVGPAANLYHPPPIMYR